MDRNRLLRLAGGARGRRAFTLVEMLVVSALIALFAGLAVFSITTQLDQNRKKAAVAECRQIATAMSFAHDDLSFFPKICFLKFNYDNLNAAAVNLGLTPSAIEYHSHFIPQIETKLQKNWKGIYMTNSVDRTVDMTFRYASQQGGAAGPSATMKWPADPWGNPYVAYLLKITGTGNLSQPEIKFIEKTGEDPDFFAGIVSYGRDGVPGLGEEDYQRGDLITGREPYRLFTRTAPGKFTMLNEDEYNASVAPALAGNPTRVDMFIAKPDTPAPDGRPRTLEGNTSDRVYQF